MNTLLQIQTFSNIFKKSFLEGWTSQEISPVSVLITLLITGLLCLYVFFVYRLISRKTFYSRGFNISLVGVGLITSAIIITIQSSIVISLGMVGALSIVRFRTAVKNPIDLMFLFWAISIGIICGAGYSINAVFLSIILTLGVFFLEWIPISKAPLICIINANPTAREDEIMKIISLYCKHATIKARNITKVSQSFTIEIAHCKDIQSMLSEINSKDNVQSTSCLAHDGEVTF